jgi:hypothetical protein
MVQNFPAGHNESAIVIEPVTEYHPQSGDCKQENVMFSKTVVLDPQLKGEYLVHFRALNGAAINKVIEFGF